MSRLKLKSATLRNFGSVRQSVVEFPDRGLVLVNGLNETGAGKFESVGSGKTLLGEAISRTLFNVPGRYTKLAGFSTGGKGDTYVSVRAEMDGRPLLVELGYRCAELSKSGEGLRFTLEGDTPVQRATIDQTRDELAKLVGLTPEVAAWTVYIDGSQLNFGRLSEAQTVTLLMGALNQPPWHEYLGKVKKARDEFTTDLRVSKSAHDAALAAVKTAQSSAGQSKTSLVLVEAELAAARIAWRTRQMARESNIELNSSNLTGAKAAMAGLKARIDEAVNSEAEAYAQAELMVNELDSSLAAARRSLVEFRAEAAAAEKSLKEAESRFSTAKSAARRTLSADFQLARSKRDMARNALVVEVDLAVAGSAKASKQLGATDLKIAKIEAVPTTCPLAGCDKTWPRPNQKELDALNTAKGDLLVLAATAAELESLAKARLVTFDLEPVPLTQHVDDDQLQVPPEFQLAVDSAVSNLNGLESRCATAETAVGSIDLARDAARKVVDGLTKASAVKPMSIELEALTKKSDGWVAASAALRLAQANDTLDESKLHRAEAAEAECRRQLLEATSALDATATNLSDSEQAVSVAEYWSEAFSPTGIPNLIIEEAIAPLNDVSRRVAFAMTGGVLSVSYATNRALASGKVRSEIVMQVENLYGSGAANGSSKGEAGLTDLIVAETLAEVGNVASRIGYRWYDEVARSQDQCVRRSLFSYLKELSQRLGIVLFVVDHSPEVANYADHVLQAKKTSHGTEYAWR